MVAGVGMGTALALNGAVAHAFCHILYKALLFMGAGALIHATGKRTLDDLGGLARAMPITLILYMVGALSISGFPLFNGFNQQIHDYQRRRQRSPARSRTLAHYGQHRHVSKHWPQTYPTSLFSAPSAASIPNPSASACCSP